MFSINSKLASLCLIPISMMIVLGKFLMPYLDKIFQREPRSIGELTNKITEAFTNIHVIKANAREEIFLLKEQSQPMKRSIDRMLNLFAFVCFSSTTYDFNGYKSAFGTLYWREMRFLLDV